MEQKKEKAVNLTWTWYLFLLANVLLIIGITISWLLRTKVAETSAWLPIVICNIISMILIALFYYFDSKEIYLLKQHIPTKYFKVYFIGGFIFIVNLIFISTFIALSKYISHEFDTEWVINAPYAILFGVSALLTIISIGVHRYARYKIDLTLLLRRRGEMAQEPKKDTPPSNEQTPTSSLTQNADSQ